MPTPDKPFEHLLAEADAHAHALDDVDQFNYIPVARELRDAANNLETHCPSMAQFLSVLADKVDGS